MKLSSNLAFLRKGSRTSQIQDNLSPTSEPLFHLTPRCLLIRWFLLLVTSVKLRMSVTATPSCALSPMDRRWLTLEALHHLLPTDHPHLLRAPTNHHHHFPRPRTTLQPPPTSLCPFGGNRLPRVPYLWSPGSPLGTLQCHGVCDPRDSIVS